MYEKIWYEFIHYKSGDYYLVLYIDKIKLTRKIANISTLLLSTTGILSWKIWVYLPAVTSSIIALIQAFRLIENELIPSDKEIEKLYKLREMYYEHSILLENLFIDFRSEEISERDAKQNFFALREKTKEIKSFNNRTNVQISKRLQDKADKKTTEYINQYHS
jgi:hypothetical protein